MENSLSKPQEYFYAVLGSLSFIFGMIFLFCYAKLKSFPHPPGVLILWISVSCTFISFYYSFSSLTTLLSLYPANTLSPQSSICSFQGFLVFFMRILSWNLSLVLSIELIQKVPEGFQSRVLYYNVLCVCLTCLLSGLGFITDSFGMSFSHTCYLKEGSFGEHSVWVFWAYAPFVLTAVVCKAPKDYRISQKLLFTFWTCNFPFGINQVCALVYGTNEWLVDFEAFFASAVGLGLYLVALVYYVSRNKLQVALLESLPTEHTEENLSELKKYKLAVVSLLTVFEKSTKFVSSSLEDTNCFSSEQTFELSRNSDNEIASVLPCSVIQYAGEVFASICANDNINKSELIDALLTMKNDQHLVENNSNHCHKFLIKFVNNSQLHFFLSILHRFYKHLVENSRNKSLLNRVIGAFTVKEKRNCYNFVVIENIFSFQSDCEMFELSGSKIVKQVLDGSRGKVFNDLDFMQKYTRLMLKFSERNLLIKVFNDDLEFLKTIGALEYTFFLAVINRCNKIGLTNRFTRHYFDGKNKKVYAIGLIYNFINYEMVDGSRLKKIGGVKEYADRFTKLLTQITQCEDF